MKNSFLKFILVLSLLSPFLLIGQDLKKISFDDNSPEAKVDAVFENWNKPNTPGAAVAVVKNGEVILEKGYGMANLEYDVPITPSTIFQIASVSKQFTVFAILLLEKEGKLNLDDDIRKHLPEVPDFGEKISLRHLASHTSGLRDQWALLEMAGWQIADVITQEDILELVRKQENLNFAPGEEFMYSNTGFTLLAEVVEKVSGKSFAEFSEERIFEPLRMQSTLVYDDYRKVVKNRAYSYYNGKTGYRKGVLNVEAVGQGNIFSSASDMAKWVINLQDPKVGVTSMINRMNELQVLNNGEIFEGALGQFVKEYRGLKEIEHAGRTVGFNSHVSRFPEQDFAVSILSNSAELEADEMVHKIADIYLEGRFKEKQEVPVAKVEPVIVTSIVLDKETINSYLGEYEFQPGIVFSIIQENGQLMGKPTGGTALKLLPISTDEFWAEGAKFVFIKDPGKKAEVLKLYNGGEVYEMNRVVPFDKATVNLSDYTGEFFSDEISNVYDLKVIDDQLLAEPQNIRMNRIILKPVKADLFQGSSPHYREVRFVRNVNGSIVGFKVSSERVKNLYFEKRR